MQDGFNSNTDKSGFSTMSSSIENADNYVAWILSKFKPHIGKSLLEIGTGFGNFRKHIGDVDQFVSIDISEDSILRARTEDPSGKYLTADVTSEDFIERIGGPELFETIMLVNVLEHLENPDAGLRNIFTALKPGGRILILVPALQALYTDLDKLAGHYVRFDKKGLKQLVLRTGFLISTIEYFNPIGGLGWWINGFAKHNDLDSKSVNSQIELFDKYIIHVSKLMNYLTKGFFGQSLICIAKKP